MRRAKRSRYDSRSARQNQRLEFDCELLEDRHLLSGMVNVSVKGSVLHVVGDGLDNEVHMNGLSVTGENGTTIAPDQSYTDDIGNVRSVSIKLLDGDDVLRLSNLSIAALRGNLTIQGGHGNNNIRVEESSVKNCTVTNEIGNDIVVLHRTQVGDDRHGNLKIDNGSGEGRVWISSALGIGKSVHGNVTVTNWGQYSQLRMTGVRVRNGTIAVKHNGGDSDVQIENCDKIKNANVTTGSVLTGTHRFQISSTDVHGSVNIKNGFGAAETIIDSFSLIGKNVTISTRGIGDSATCDTQVLQSFIGGSLKVTNKMAGTQTELISSSLIEKGMTLAQQPTGGANLASTHTTNIQGGTEVGGKVAIKTKGGDSSQQNVHIQGALFLGDVVTSTSVRSDVKVENSVMNSLAGGAATVSDNKFDVANTVVTKDLKISHSRSGNLITVKNSFVGKNALISSGLFEAAGLESVLIEGTVIAGNLTVASAAANSVTSLHDVQVDRHFKVKLTGGTDTVNLDDVIIAGKTDLNLIGGRGTNRDIVWIEQGTQPGNSVFYGAVKIRTGDGDDAVEFGTTPAHGNARFEWTVLVDGGAGSDLFRYTPDTYFAFPCNVKNFELP